MKTICITFFNIKHTVHFEFSPKGQKVKQVYYVKLSKRLHEDVRRKRTEHWPNEWIFHHDTAPAHMALSVKWNSHPTTIIWLRMTSGCFQKQSVPQRDEHFRMLKTSTKKCDDTEIYSTTEYQKYVQQ
jgi:hypothetical protein